MRRKKKKFKIKYKYIFMLVVVVYLASIFIKQEIEIKELDKDIAKESKEKAELEKYIDEKGKEAEYLNKISTSEDPIAYINSLDNPKERRDHREILKHIETIAREELLMVKPNEIIYIDKNKEKSMFEEED